MSIKMLLATLSLTAAIPTMTTSVNAAQEVSAISLMKQTSEVAFRGVQRALYSKIALARPASYDEVQKAVINYSDQQESIARLGEELGTSVIVIKAATTVAGIAMRAAEMAENDPQVAAVLEASKAELESALVAINALRLAVEVQPAGVVASPQLLNLAIRANEAILEVKEVLDRAGITILLQGQPMSDADNRI